MNPLFQKVNSQTQKPERRNAVLNQLQNFASRISGDPRQMVQQIVEERGVTQEQLHQVVQGAKAFMEQFGLK